MPAPESSHWLRPTKGNHGRANRTPFGELWIEATTKKIPTGDLLCDCSLLFYGLDELVGDWGTREMMLRRKQDEGEMDAGFQKEEVIKSRYRWLCLQVSSLILSLIIEYRKDRKEREKKREREKKPKNTRGVSNYASWQCVNPGAHCSFQSRFYRAASEF